MLAVGTPLVNEILVCIFGYFASVASLSDSIHYLQRVWRVSAGEIVIESNCRAIMDVSPWFTIQCLSLQHTIAYARRYCTGVPYGCNKIHRKCSVYIAFIGEYGIQINIQNIRIRNDTQHFCIFVSQNERFDSFAFAILRKKGEYLFIGRRMYGVHWFVLQCICIPNGHFIPT